MATGITMDSVVINIESDAGKAVSNIDKLATSLSNLRTSIKGGFDGLTKLNAAMSGLATTAEKMDSIASQMGKVAEIVEAMKGLGDIKSSGLRDAIGSLKNIPDTFAKITPETIRNVARVSNELSQALTPLAEKMGQIGQGYQQMQHMADQYGKSATTVNKYTKQTSAVFNSFKSIVSKVSSGLKAAGTRLQNFGKTTQKTFKRLNSTIKQVGLSLLGTRTLFTAVRKSISEYMQMDRQLSESLSNVWRALGALMAPAVEQIIYLFKQFARVVYSIIKALTGIDLIARANAKAMSSLGKSASDALGTLQKFDDLNVVEFPDNGAGDLKQIDLKEIDLSPIQKIMDWIKKMKEAILEAFNNGKWRGVGEVFGQGITEGLAFVVDNLDVLQNAFNKVATEFAEFLNGAIANINWTDVFIVWGSKWTLMFNTISTFIKKIDWSEVGKGLNEAIRGIQIAEIFDSFANIFIELGKGLGDAIAELDTTLLAEKISGILISAFSNFGKVLESIPWKELGIKIHETLVKLDWSGIGFAMLQGLSGALQSLGEIVSGLFLGINIDEETATGIGGAIAGVVLAMGALVKLSKPLKSIDKVAKGVESLGKGFESLGAATKYIAVLGGLAIVLGSITNMFTAFADTGLSVSDGLTLIGGSLLTLVLAVGALGVAIRTLQATDLLGLVVVLGGLSTVFLSLGYAMGEISKTGADVGDVINMLLVVMGGLVAVVAVAGALGTSLTAALPGLALIIVGIVGTLATMAATIPIILDACGKFITTIAPSVETILRTIGDLIENIILALGTALPPIIRSVGSVFNTIFSGIANIVNSVGNTIVNILGAAGNLVNTVLTSILGFINRLGPAINNFVDNAIRAVTKLINFIVSSVEYLINTAIINPINSLIRKINDNAIAEKLGWQIGTLGRVNIERFAPKLETGTNEIPYEGLYHLHPGEAVVPKKYNPALGGTTNETNQKLDTLIAIMENMNFTNVVNIGNKKVYEGQQSFNKMQQNKYGTTNVY